MANSKQSLSEPAEIEIALLPEIAIARVGSAADPVDCYEWAGPDDRPDRTGKTFVAKRPTLVARQDGVITRRNPKKWKDNPSGQDTSSDQELSDDDPVEFAVLARDGKSQALRPVAPWFVVCMKKGDDWSPLMPSDLKRIGATSEGISWHVLVANRKAYNMTLALEDIVYASEDVKREDYAEHYRERPGHLIEKQLIGKSDATYWERYPPADKPQIDGFNKTKSLVPAGEDRLSFGRIQVPRISEEHGIRLRFIPPRGEVYGPKNLREKIDRLTKRAEEEDGNSDNFDDWQLLNLIVDADFDRLKKSVLNLTKEKKLRLPDDASATIDEAKRLAKLSDDRRAEIAKKINVIIKEIKKNADVYPDDGFYGDESSKQAQDIVRTLSLVLDEGRKKTFCILNGNSAWANKLIRPGGENRTLPVGQFAHIQLGNGSHSLGLLDDFCDGIVRVTIASRSGKDQLTAESRIIVGPPDLAPDRRHPMPLQAVVEDRRYLAYIDAPDEDNTHPSRLSKEEVRAEVADLFRRINEIIGLTNLDASNTHFADKPVFPVDPSEVALNQLPLSQKAQETHRRLASIENLEATFREYVNRKHDRNLNFNDPTDARGLVNLPPGVDGQVPAENYWNRMLVLLRGSQYGPLHLTKRQIAVFERWLGLLGVPWD